MRITTERAQDVQKTINGGIDITYGGVYTRVNMVLYVPYDTDTIGNPGPGIYEDLVTFYGYVDPDGAATPMIQFTDYFGVTHSAYLVGNLEAEPLCGNRLDDTESYYICPVELIYENAGKPT